MDYAGGRDDAGFGLGGARDVVVIGLGHGIRRDELALRTGRLCDFLDDVVIMMLVLDDVVSSSSFGVPHRC